MKKQYFINANIIDPHNSINENGGLIIGEDGKIEAIGKKVNTNNLPTREKPTDLKGKYIFPGIVDMRVFVGEPGYEYKENFRTLSNAALSGGVTSVVTMVTTDVTPPDNAALLKVLKFSLYSYPGSPTKTLISTIPGNIYLPFKSVGFSLVGKLFVFTFFPIASIFPSSPIINPPFSFMEL